MKIELMSSLIVFTFLSGPAQACGLYELEGFVREHKGRAVIFVNEKSKSQVTITAPVNWEAKLYAYMNRPVTATILIDKKFDGTKGSLTAINKIELRVPDPVYHPVEKLKVLKQARCK